MLTEKQMIERCTECGSEIFKDIETCRSCDGTGEGEDDLDWHGCLSCEGGEVITWRCECDPYGEDSSAD